MNIVQNIQDNLGLGVCRPNFDTTDNV